MIQHWFLNPDLSQEIWHMQYSYPRTSIMEYYRMILTQKVILSGSFSKLRTHESIRQ